MGSYPVHGTLALGYGLIKTKTTIEIDNEDIITA